MAPQPTDRGQGPRRYIASDPPMPQKLYPLVNFKESEYGHKIGYIDSKFYIFQNCQMETAKEGNLLRSMYPKPINGKYGVA